MPKKSKEAKEAKKQEQPKKKVASLPATSPLISAMTWIDGVCRRRKRAKATTWPGSVRSSRRWDCESRWSKAMETACSALSLTRYMGGRGVAETRCNPGGCADSHVHGTCH